MRVSQLITEYGKRVEQRETIVLGCISELSTLEHIVHEDVAQHIRKAIEHILKRHKIGSRPVGQIELMREYDRHFCYNVSQACSSLIIASQGPENDAAHNIAIRAIGSILFELK